MRTLNLKPSTVRVALGARSYDISIESGSLARTGEIARTALGNARRIALFSNARVFELCGKRVERSLKAAGFLPLVHLVSDGERAKSIRTAERAWTALLANRFERGDAILALGGGVVGDLAGFVAATFLRGIPHLQVPTTLLAQIDSSVGGKTAINHPLGKNLIGAFHQPAAVIIDPSVLRTLPRRELRAGLYEALKYGVIRDAELASFLRDRMTQIRALDLDVLTAIITRCCEIKAEVVATDEREGGLRKILNFGHTVGHALEAVTSFRLLKHGEAVGYGMKCATSIAERIGLIARSEALDIVKDVNAIGPLPSIEQLASKEITAAMAHDKKVVRGRLSLILPTRIGDVVVRDDVAMPVVRSAVRALIEGKM